MNSYTIRAADMFDRIERCMLENPITPALPRFTAARAELTAVIAAIREAAEDQFTGAGESSGGVDLRIASMRALRAYLRNVNRTGRMLDADHPGIGGVFKLPRNTSYPQLLVAADAIHAKAAEYEADFIASGHPETFLTELAALIASFRAASNQKHDGGQLRSGNTAALKFHTARGIAAADILDTCMRNHFRNNPEVLAAWTTARHIQRPPRSTATTTPPPSGGSGSSGGSTPTGS